MRITRDTLLNIARTTAQERTESSRTLVCIYLTGSLLSETPLLGGSTDIDLIFIHSQEPPVSREIIRLTDEVHLDLAHFSQVVFSQPRKLRHDPWLGGYLIENPLVLFDTRHWFEFTQASVGARFQSPENMLGRAKPLAQSARSAWLKMAAEKGPTTPQRLLTLLETLEIAGNAAACLSGVPLTERRFWMQFPGRAQALDRPQLASSLLNLIMPAPTTEDDWRGWLLDWEHLLETVASQSNCPTRLHAARRMYYTSAVKALQQENPVAAFWLLNRTWTLAASTLRTGSPAMHAWTLFCEKMGFAETAFPERLSQLDLFLDQVEEAQDDYAHQNGI